MEPARVVGGDGPEREDVRTQGRVARDVRGAQGGVVGAVGAFAVDVEQCRGALSGEVRGGRVQAGAVCVGVGAGAQQRGHQGEGAGGLGEDGAAAVPVVHAAQDAGAVLESGDGSFADAASAGELAGGGQVGRDPGEQ